MKHCKKQLSYLLLLSLLLGLLVLPVGAGSGSGCQVSVDDVTGSIGSRVCLNLNLSGNTKGISALTVDVFYNTAVLTGVEDTDATTKDKDGNDSIWKKYADNSGFTKPYAEHNANASLAQGDPHYGESNWAKMTFAYTKAEGGSPMTTESGVLGRLTFDVVESVNVGAKSALLVRIAEPWGGTGTGMSVDIGGKDGTFTAVDGQPVSGKVTSYNPNNATTLELKKNGVAQFTTTIAAAAGSGKNTQNTQNFSFSAVAADTYDLVVTKAGHLTYTITGVVVGDTPLDLGTLTLLCGDVNGDAYTNFEDYSILLSPANYDKRANEANDPAVDLNGDGWINFEDYSLLLSPANYDKSATAHCRVAYNP